jgi:hypothetical protein
MCRLPVRLFPVDAVPGDRIYFKLEVDAPGELTLRDADGRLIETEVRTIGGDRVFAPRAAVPPEQTLTLTYALVCQRGVPPQAPQTFTFKTVANGDQSQPSLNLAIRDAGMRFPGTANAERFVRLAYDSQANSAQRHLQDVYVWVDGKAHVFEGPYAGPLSGVALWDSDLELRSRCSLPEGQQRGSCIHVENYAAGKHEVEIWSTIVGAGEQPHAKLTIDLTCDAAPPDAVADAGATGTANAQNELPAALAHAAPPHQSEDQDSEALGDDERAAEALDDDKSADQPASADEEAPKAQSASNGCALGSQGSGAPAVVGLAAIAVLIARRRSARG